MLKQKVVRELRKDLQTGLTSKPKHVFGSVWPKMKIKISMPPNWKIQLQYSRVILRFLTHLPRQDQCWHGNMKDFCLKKSEYPDFLKRNSHFSQPVTDSGNTFSSWEVVFSAKLAINLAMLCVGRLAVKPTFHQTEHAVFYLIWQSPGKTPPSCCLLKTGSI